MRLRLLSYNIRYGGTGRETAIAAVVRAADADLVMLQEATDPTVVARVAELAALPHHGARPGHSTGFLSRLPIASHAWHHPPAARHALREVVLVEPAGRGYGLQVSAWFSRCHWASASRTWSSTSSSAARAPTARSISPSSPRCRCASRAA